MGEGYFRVITTISGEAPVRMGGPQVPTPLDVKRRKLSKTVKPVIVAIVNPAGEVAERKHLPLVRVTRELKRHAQLPAEGKGGVRPPVGRCARC